MTLGSLSSGNFNRHSGLAAAPPRLATAFAITTIAATFVTTAITTAIAGTLTPKSRPPPCTVPPRHRVPVLWYLLVSASVRGGVGEASAAEM